MASSSSLKYDVFLSFRGPDTRKTIVSHLYVRLRDNGILTFKDDRTIEKGDSIPEELIKAIQTSRFAIVVISENYATSTWCLEELRKIMELQAVAGVPSVVPIFYKVEPCDVRRQGGSFATAFASMGRPEMAEKVVQWREALTQVANLLGFDSSKCVDEATMVEEVVRNISGRLFTEHYSDHADDVVGMSNHMERLGSLLEMESEDEVRFVGISGMGGIGKTTIAKYLYDRFSRQFLVHCFLHDVKKIYREQGLSYLQETFHSKIFRHRSQKIKGRLEKIKVFVVLDDVDKVEQLLGLAKDPSWFGAGSRIIITTRDKGLLDTCRVDTVYPVKCLDQDDALQMFKQLVSGAGGELPPHGSEDLLIRASRLAHGLPLALKYYSSYLRRKTTEWERAVLEFEKAPHQNILDTLRSSYEGLTPREKIAFLHVACLFKGDHFLRASTLLDEGESRIKVLVEKSLVDLSAEGFLQMHVLVEQTGREIVLEESNYFPQRQRILWDPVEVCDALHENTGTESIDGLALHMCDMPDVSYIADTSLELMPSVKFFKFYKHLIDRESKLQLLPHTASLPRKLRLLHWDAYPLTTLPSEFFARSLVELTLRYSNLQSLHNRNLDLQKLKRLDVSGSEYLRELPDLSRAMQLEELVAEDCRRLERILISIRNRYKLRKLDLSNCVGLQNLPAFIPQWISVATEPIYFRCQGTRLKFEIKALEPFVNLSIEGDIKIRLQQQLVGDADHLSYISDQQTTGGLRLESQTFGKLLDIKRSSYIEGKAPFRCVSLSAFTCLAELKLINLNIHKIPDDIYRLESLEKLDLSGNDFKYLPTTLDCLEKLNNVMLGHCRKLEELPNLTQLQTLKLSGCTNLPSLPVAHWGRYRLLELDLHNCKNVQSLTHQLGQFTKLMLLDLSRHDFQTIPTSITKLLPLGTLCLNNCKELKSLKELPLSLNYLNAHGCNSLETVSLPLNHSIRHLDLSDCSHLNQNEELITQFLTVGQQEEATLRFACIPGNVMPSCFNDQSPRPSTNFMGFTACIMIACKKPFHVQFPASSYSWNWEAGGVFRISLKPHIYRLSEMEEQEEDTSHHLVIIHVLSNINNDKVDNFLFKLDLLQCSEELTYPPVEIKANRITMISQDS